MDTATLRDGVIESVAVGQPVDVRVLTPPGWRAGDTSPVILLLHGAMSSAASLDLHAPLFGELWADGRLPPAVVGCASTPTQGGFYIDWPGGPRWEEVVAVELPRFLADRYGADVSRLCVTGASMGGYGALKLAFRDPDRYVAAAAVAPAVFPADTGEHVPERNRPIVLGDLHDAIAASPGDALDVRLRENLGAIVEHGPALFLGVGGADEFLLQEGTEHLHRLLWDLGVGHEYVVRHGAGHTGAEMVEVQRVAFAFVGAALTADAGPPASDDGAW